MSDSSLILNEPIANGLDVIGDRWTLLILREAFYGRTRFDEFQLHTGASRSTLARRLKTLVENHIFYRHPYKESTKRHEYRFTERGLNLLGSSLMAARWESDWQVGGQTDIAEKLFHVTCGSYMKPEAVCRNCKAVLSYQDVEWQVRDQMLDAQLEEIRACNSKHRKSTARQTSNLKPGDIDIASLIGDRWSILILIAAFFGASRFDDFAKQLNIPTSILAERLKLLVQSSIFTRDIYQHQPPRYEYKLTDKGISLFPFIMTLRQWVTDNLPGAATTGTLIHKSCNKPLVIDIVCGACQQKPWPMDLKYTLSGVAYK